ncbi:hypothetical protein GCM10022237_33510 [Nocardioides ginsengisoli]|uniref:Hint domain-containing protein n=1 Tax=Nocardioides ginsengisoli TaxID=363868 RepID=A0ABW3VWI2_9ACTN
MVGDDARWQHDLLPCCDDVVLAVGPFTAVDPLLDFGDPIQANGYNYGNNNPITYSDPTGTAPTCVREGTCMASSNGSGGVPVPYATKKAVYASTAKVATNGTVSNASRTDYDDAMAVVKARGAGHRDDQMVVVDGVTVDVGEVIRSYLNDHYTEKGLPLILRLAKAVFVPDPGQCFGSNRSWTGCGLETVSLVGTFFPPLKGAKAGKVADAWHDGDKLVNAERAADAGRSLARSCLRSFAGETLVLMADGTKKPIREIEVGDKVVATDPEGGDRVTRNVTHVWVHRDELHDLVLEDSVIRTTEDHPFWSVTDHRFERAEDLGQEKVVLGDGGRLFQVSGFRSGTGRIAPAYNLSIEGVHTYHVGNDAVLVHNDCSDDAWDIAMNAYEKHKAELGFKSIDDMGDRIDAVMNASKGYLRDDGTRFWIDYENSAIIFRGPNKGVPGSFYRPNNFDRAVAKEMGRTVMGP